MKTRKTIIYVIAAVIILIAGFGIYKQHSNSSQTVGCGSLTKDSSGNVVTSDASCN